MPKNMRRGGSEELGIAGVAKLLGTPERTVKRWIAQGKLGARCVGYEPIVSRRELTRWAADHGIHLAGDEASEGVMPVQAPAGDLEAAIACGGVHINVPGRTPNEVLRALVERCPVSLEERQPLLEALIAREALASTGIGRGVAIPHPRSVLPAAGAARVWVAAGLLEHEVPWRAVDGNPVFAVFVLVAANTTLHLESLARLSFCLHDGDFVSFLREVRTSRDLIARVAQVESTFERCE